MVEATPKAEPDARTAGECSPTGRYDAPSWRDVPARGPRTSEKGWRSMSRMWAGVAAAAMAGGLVSAQPFPPGYVDPQPLLAAAAKEIGEANLQVHHLLRHRLRRRRRPDVRVRRQHRLAAHRRAGQLHADHQLGDGHQQGDLRPQARAESGVVEVRPGLAGRHADPEADATDAHRQRRARLAHRRRRRAPVAASPEDAERYQLDLWLNPPGFLKAARLPGANPKAIWRWEQIEMGRDGNVVMPEKMHVVSITMLGKYRVEATINPQNQIQRIKTTVNEPALGDFNIEHESTEQMTFGNVKWPIAWHSHQGWDDNWQFDNVSTGHNAYGGKFPNVQPERLRRSGAGARVRCKQAPCAGVGHRREDGRRRLPARRHDAQQLHGGVQRLRRRVRGAAERGAQPGGDRGGREAGARQADSLADQLAPALRSHRRPAHLPAHRLDHRDAPQGDRLPQSRRAELPAAHRRSPTSWRCGRRPSCRRATTSRPSTRTTSSPTTAASCASTTCSRWRTSPGC